MTGRRVTCTTATAVSAAAPDTSTADVRLARKAGSPTGASSTEVNHSSRVKLG
jgi:hypothetical protein